MNGPSNNTHTPHELHGTRSYEAVMSTSTEEPTLAAVGRRRCALKMYACNFGMTLRGRCGPRRRPGPPLQLQPQQHPFHAAAVAEPAAAALVPATWRGSRGEAEAWAAKRERRFAVAALPKVFLEKNTNAEMQFWVPKRFNCSLASCYRRRQRLRTHGGVQTVLKAIARRVARLQNTGSAEVISKRAFLSTWRRGCVGV